MSGPFEQMQPPPFAPERGAEGVAGTPLRSQAALGAGAAARAARARRASANGSWGMALFLAAECTIFGSLIATYFYLDFQAPHWPPYGIESPSVTLPLAATGMLVFTSLPMALAARAAKAGATGLTSLLLGSAMLVQCGYLAFQMILFLKDLHHFHPQGSAYGSIYFTLLGVHHAHVLVGILLDAGMLFWLLTRGLTSYRLVGVRVTAAYWHVVNVLAVIVVLTQISPSL